MNISRRQAVIGIAGTALFIVQGCAVFRRDSDLDTALAELETLLRSGGNDDSERQVAIASEIGQLAHNLMESQAEFSSDFNTQAANREIDADTLGQLVAEYDQRRLALRNQLLERQHELRSEVPEELWPEVLEMLNKKRMALVPQRARGA